MSQDSYALDALTWPEAGRLPARDYRPLGTNTFFAEAVARRVSVELGILLAPPFAYGVIESGRGHYAGTATLRRKTLHRAVNELLASWEDHGVSEVVVITAHRYEHHLDALLMALTSRSRTTVIDLTVAREMETSLMLHLAPERVRKDHMADYTPSSGNARRYIRQRMPTAPVGSWAGPSSSRPRRGRPFSSAGWKRS
jgi:creatinine amidohydrolase/Fe(II)-dependent formamide hydrolase-like protein